MMTQPREFELIERFFTRPAADPSVRLGVGDDAAIIGVEGDLSVAVDTLVAGTHFPAGLDAWAIGHRSLAVNLSDLAAMGAKPRWATLALTLPGADGEWLEGFAAGFFELAGRYAVSLVGGDTTRGPLTVSVQLIGQQTAPPLLRSAGQVGDLVFVSGSLGDSAAGLEFFETGPDRLPDAALALIERFRRPEPRVDLGLALAGLAHAAIDISDGLVADLTHVCKQSGCRAVIRVDELPLSSSLAASVSADAAIEHALHGGDDYELCFTAAPDDRERVLEAAAGVATPVTEIGVLTKGAGVVGMRGSESSPLVPHGFRHFD